MKGVTILDRDHTRGGLGFDLGDVVAVLGDDAERSSWTIADVECVGGAAATALHHASDTGESVSGERLIRLAADVGQIIDGEFVGCLPGESVAWIVIRAVDSSAFDVETDREDVLAALRARFASVVDLPVDTA